jgi:hypothetical protein
MSRLIKLCHMNTDHYGAPTRPHHFYHIYALIYRCHSSVTSTVLTVTRHLNSSTLMAIGPWASIHSRHYHSLLCNDWDDIHNIKNLLLVCAVETHQFVPSRLTVGANQTHTHVQWILTLSGSYARVMHTQTHGVCISPRTCTVDSYYRTLTNRVVIPWPLHNLLSLEVSVTSTWKSHIDDSCYESHTELRPDGPDFESI